MGRMMTVAASMSLRECISSHLFLCRTFEQVMSAERYCHGLLQVNVRHALWLWPHSHSHNAILSKPFFKSGISSRPSSEIFTCETAGVHGAVCGKVRVPDIHSTCLRQSALLQIQHLTPVSEAELQSPPDQTNACLHTASVESVVRNRPFRRRLRHAKKTTPALLCERLLINLVDINTTSRPSKLLYSPTT